MTPYNFKLNAIRRPMPGGRMLVKLKSGLTLALPEVTPPEALRDPNGIFILDGSPCAIPDLAITPAYLALATRPSDVYELHQYEIVLGTTDELLA